MIADETGDIVALYDKQHPSRGRGAASLHHDAAAARREQGIGVPGMICYDIDFNDLVRHVAAAGVLAVPANDWRSFADIHHRAAVWEAVRAGVPRALDRPRHLVDLRSRRQSPGPGV